MVNAMSETMSAANAHEHGPWIMKSRWPAPGTPPAPFLMVLSWSSTAPRSTFVADGYYFTHEMADAAAAAARARGHVALVCELAPRSPAPTIPSELYATTRLAVVDDRPDAPRPGEGDAA
jgi:hypothetical protein